MFWGKYFLGLGVNVKMESVRIEDRMVIYRRRGEEEIFRVGGDF